MQCFAIRFRPQRCTFFRFNVQPLIGGSFIVLHLYCERCFVQQHVKRHKCDLFCQRIVRQGVVNSDLCRGRQTIKCECVKNDCRILTSYFTPSALHSTTPVEPAASSENLSLHSPFSTWSDARFLPKKTFSRYENRIGPSWSGGWYKTFTFSSDDWAMEESLDATCNEKHITFFEQVNTTKWSQNDDKKLLVSN